MNPDKDKQLIKTYEDVIRIGFYDRHMDDLETIYAEDFTYFGTGLDERGLTREEFRELILRMREQGSEYSIEISKTPIFHSFLNNNTSALFVDEFHMKVGYQEQRFDINVRHTILFDKQNDHWVAVHLHGSVAYDFQPEGSAWPIEEIRKKNLELEALVEQRTSELNQSLHELKSTQDQLIHSEKMASLGVLISGVAHEIKNPLNFINNFSDINSELIYELKDAIKESDLESAYELIDLMSENIEKINTHSIRADAILKSMELHSPVNSGKRTKTNLNKIIESDSRLVYYSKFTEKDFDSIKIEYDLDLNIPEIFVNQNEISRSFINLFSNALDAVTEKMGVSEDGYVPEISITTKNEYDHIVISICDNGIGIPDEIRDKIYQPFFTTKPTGKGIGLGLSLTYDTVCNLYSGSLQLKSNDPCKTEFIITLPKTNLMAE